MQAANTVRTREERIVPSASSAALKAECPDATLLERLNFYFDTLVADTPSLLRQAHEIRYAVYCVETGFEDAASFPDGLERDALDAHAVHEMGDAEMVEHAAAQRRRRHFRGRVSDGLPAGSLLQRVFHDPAC